jgi:hypothetical protein
MQPEYQYRLAKAQQEETLRKAELVYLAQSGSTPKQNAALATVGRQLVKLGERLQGQETVLPTGRIAYDAQ